MDPITSQPITPTPAAESWLGRALRAVVRILIASHREGMARVRARDEQRRQDKALAKRLRRYRY